MINDYKNYINIDKLGNHKFIFGPNSSGKTLFCEDLIEINKKNNEIKIINNKIGCILNINKETSMLQNSNKSSFDEDWNPELEPLQPKGIPFLTQKDKKFINKWINKFKIKISNKSNNKDLQKIKLDEIIIKSNNRKVKLNTWKDSKTINSEEKLRTKLQISASELEILIISIALIAYSNINIKIYLDDPIELASWTNENLFINILKYALDKKKALITVLTHRISLFKLLIGNFHKLKINNLSPSYIYYMDDRPYWLDTKNDRFELEYLFNPKSLEKPIIERMMREIINQYAKKLLKNDDRKYFKFNQNKINELSNCAKKNEYKITYFQKNDDLKIAIINKILFIVELRKLILKDYNSKYYNKIDKLKNIKINHISKTKAFKKNHSNEQILYFHNILNQSSHKYPQDWLLFSEINIFDIIFIFEKNYHYSWWKKSSKLIKSAKKIIIEENKKIENAEKIPKDFEKIIPKNIKKNIKMILRKTK